jgi:hypothetical protein
VTGQAEKKVGIWMVDLGSSGTTNRLCGISSVNGRFCFLGLPDLQGGLEQGRPL